MLLISGSGCCLKCCLRLVVILIVVHCEVYLDEDELMEGRQQLFI